MVPVLYLTCPPVVQVTECQSLSLSWDWPVSLPPPSSSPEHFFEGHLFKVLFDRLGRVLEQVCHSDLSVSHLPVCLSLTYLSICLSFTCLPLTCLSLTCRPVCLSAV